MCINDELQQQRLRSNRKFVAVFSSKQLLLKPITLIQNYKYPCR